MKWQTVIGIEIHFELNTKTKMFSGAPYEFKKPTNTCTNEIDLAHPGCLPCVNIEAVKKAIVACKALNMNIDTLIKFDRKNYFYSDLTKGFQITQQFHPIGSNGYVIINENGKDLKIGIDRLHMEEDTAKQFHLKNETLIDFNRAGVPLVEVVSKPDIRNGLQASLYVEKLRQIFTYFNCSNAKMEEGSMRCDVNISVNELGSIKFGNKVEIKNLNSINNIKEAIDFETQRQISLLESGQEIIQETRRFDEKTQTTVSMRKKEGAIDYKYFPEPNIFPIRLNKEFVDEVISNMKQMPDEKRNDYLNKYNLSDFDVNILMNDQEIAKFYDLALIDAKNPKLLCNLILTDLCGALTKDNKNIKDIDYKQLTILSNYINDSKLSSKQAKIVIDEIIKNNTVDSAIEKFELVQNSNEDEILKIVVEVLENNKQSILDFKNGKDRALGYLVGQVIKQSKGKANPAIANKLIKQELEKI